MIVAPRHIHQLWRQLLKRQLYAARTVSRNLSTSSLSRLLSLDRDCAEDSTCTEAAPVSPAPRFTSVILAATCAVHFAASLTLREINWVAVPCSSMAAAIADAISKIWPMVSLIS